MADRGGLAPAQPLTAAELARSVVTEQTRELVNKAPMARKSAGIEAVHDMRVASRRLRSTLDVLGADLAVRDELARRLEWIARVLGRVRDRDVMLALLERSSKGLRLRGQEARRLSQLKGRLRERRFSAQHDLRRALKRARWDKLIQSLKRFAREPKLLSGMDDVGARVLAQVDMQAATIAAHPGMGDAKPTAGQLHKLRIAFKRLRYVLEVHAALDMLAFGAELRLARDLQDVLGEIHDHDLLLERLDGEKGAFRGPWRRLRPAVAQARASLLRRFKRLRGDWIRQTKPKPPPAVESLRFVNLEPQPVTLRLVSGQ